MPVLWRPVPVEEVRCLETTYGGKAQSRSVSSKGAPRWYDGGMEEEEDPVGDRLETVV